MGGISMTTIINIALYALLAFAGIVIVGIALLVIITTIVFLARRDRLTSRHDGE